MIHKQIAVRYCPVESVDKLKKRNHNLGRLCLFRPRCYFLLNSLLFIGIIGGRHIVSLGQSHGPKIYHNWLQRLYLKISVTIVSVINYNHFQQTAKTLKARWMIATLSSSTLLMRHIYVEHTLNARLTSRYAFPHAMKTLGERYSYGINTMISRFRDVRYTLRTR